MQPNPPGRPPPGRPPLDPTQPSTSVSFALPLSWLDALCLRAEQAGVSVPEIIRRDLQRAAAINDELAE